MRQLITGIHHITAVASDAQKNIDFYAGILGLRLVKKSLGVLLEIVTSGPGFAVDKPAEHLGMALQLPQQFEPDREEIERTLFPITMNIENYK